MNLTRLKATVRKRGVAPGLTAGGLAAVAVLSFAVSAQSNPPGPPMQLSPDAVLAAADGAEARLFALKAGFDPSTASLVTRHDPIRHPDLWGRPSAWASYDVSRAPSLGLSVISVEDARKINSLLPASGAPLAKPFFLKAHTAAERARALRCLTQAVYYEAALEPLAGQEAVAQVVLNRVRHPEYPNSVCGVVYQGWERWTGCQFSFTCDGSLLRAPMPAFWRRAEEVAVAALNGRVQPAVGTATHYHADYVMPYWRPSLTKVGQIGAHIFYRWPGNAGLPGAFTSRYTPSGEVRLSDLVLAGRAGRPTPKPSDIETLPGLPADAPITVETIQVAGVDGQQTTRVRSIIGGRRMPTPEDIARINAVLSQPAAPGPAVVAAAAVEKPAPYADGLPMPSNKPVGVTEIPVTEVNKPAPAADTAAAG
jgi:spore germination cell wall hydrolase CwlJ-like protein